VKDYWIASLPFSMKLQVSSFYRLHCHINNSVVTYQCTLLFIVGNNKLLFEAKGNLFKILFQVSVLLYNITQRYSAVMCLSIYTVKILNFSIFSLWYWRFEFRTFHLLGRRSTTWTMPPAIFYFRYFSYRVLHFCPGLASDCNTSTYISQVAGILSIL
jgi:hypothetical protein